MGIGTGIAGWHSAGARFLMLPSVHPRPILAGIPVTLTEWSLPRNRLGKLVHAGHLMMIFCLSAVAQIDRSDPECQSGACGFCSACIPPLAPYLPVAPFVCPSLHPELADVNVAAGTDSEHDWKRIRQRSRRSASCNCNLIAIGIVASLVRSCAITFSHESRQWRTGPATLDIRK